jgi:RNA polymerase sigma-70 factor (ECF subfamily)
MDSVDSSETRRLLDEARAGRPEAVDQLLGRHRDYLRRLVELRLDPRVRARVDPSDVVQEAQLEAVRRLDGYLRQPPLPFRLWLRQLAYDRLLMAQRRHVRAACRAACRAVGRDEALPDRSSLLLARRLLDARSGPGERLARQELARRVREAVARLSEADREIVLLRNFEGLSNQEAAALLQIRADAASQRYGRALLRLRQLLLDQGFGGSQP